jgi:hypothetical protein
MVLFGNGRASWGFAPSLRGPRMTRSRETDREQDDHRARATSFKLQDDLAKEVALAPQLAGKRDQSVADIREPQWAGVGALQRAKQTSRQSTPFCRAMSSGAYGDCRPSTQSLPDQTMDKKWAADRRFAAGFAHQSADCSAVGDPSQIRVARLAGKAAMSPLARPTNADARWIARDGSVLRWPTTPRSDAPEKLAERCRG